jgi:hypothetical protein
LFDLLSRNFCKNILIFINDLSVNFKFSKAVLNWTLHVDVAILAILVEISLVFAAFAHEMVAGKNERRIV